MEQNTLDLEQSIIEEKDYYEAYLGNNVEYYAVRFDKIDAGQTIVFNIYAFFFGFFWLTYKKLYIEGLIILVIITAIQYFLPENGGVDRFINILFAIGMGCFGNYLYYKKTIRVVEKTREKYKNNEQISQTDILNILHKKGKTDWIIFIIAFIALISLSILGIMLSEY